MRSAAALRRSACSGRSGRWTPARSSPSPPPARSSAEASAAYNKTTKKRRSRGTLPGPSYSFIGLRVCRRTPLSVQQGDHGVGLVQDLHSAAEIVLIDIRAAFDHAVGEIAVTLGSGLGDVADSIEEIAVINYRDIPGFPVSTVAGHRGRFYFCKIGEKNVAFMQGRVHYYEGYPIKECVMPLRVLHKMGCKTIMLTNAAGGVNFSFNAGDIMLIRDHISSLVPSPLIGENYPEGTRFPDMSNVYDTDLVEKIKAAASDCGVEVKAGVYLQTTGPNYETPAEIRLYKALGADAVGMSTTVEAMAAVHAGVKVAGISCITNKAAGLSNTHLSHEDVQSTADKAKAGFTKLLLKTIEII